MIKTKITEMLGVEKPVLGAPMFLVSYPKLVAAVSNAGGVGCFPALNYRSVEELRTGLREIREMTDKPIGVNLILYKDHNPNWPRQLEVCLEEKVELFITSLGTPRTVVQDAKSIGAKVFCDVTTLRHANIVAKAGADALIAVAQGAGGHAGAISPFSLIPYLKEETDLPVIAAGSIGNGAQMAAAFSLGAEAVYVGTRLIASDEARADERYKQMVVDSAPEEIEYTDRISGIPANWLKRSIEKLEQGPDAPAHSGDMTKEYKQWKDVWSAGHGVGQIKAVRPAAAIVDEMISEYEQVVAGLPRSR